MNRTGRFTNRARKVLTLAREEAKRLNDGCIGTEYLLLGLIREAKEGGVAAEILEILGINLEAVKTEILKIFKPITGDMCSSGIAPFTLSAEKAIEFAMDEADNMEYNYVGTGHLLLGLIRVEEEVSRVKILSKFGLTADKVRQEIKLLRADTSISSKKKEPAGGEEVEEIDARIIRLKEEVKELMELIKSADIISLPNATYDYYMLKVISKQNDIIIGCFTLVTGLLTERIEMLRKLGK